MDDYMFVAVCPCGRRTMATKGSPALCVACLEKLFAEPVNQTPQSPTEPGTSTPGTSGLAPQASSVKFEV
jgi:hypothetical protein